MSTKFFAISAEDVIKRKSSSLVYEPDTTSSETNNKDLTQAINLLNELESKTVPTVQTEAPLVFRKLILALRVLNEFGLRSIWNIVSKKELENTFLNALQLVGTAPSISIMTELYTNGQLSSDLAQSWLSSVTFIKYPTKSIISVLMV